MSVAPKRRPSPPAYVRIAASIRDRIDDGDLRPGAPLPAERDLAQSFGVSRMTARHAVMVLESEGYVVRNAPRGTFVATGRLPMRIGSFSDEIVRRGLSPGDELLWAELEAPTPLVADALRLSEPEQVNALQRLRSADEEAIAIETTYFPANMTPGLLELELTGSLWEILRRHYSIVARRATATLEVVTLDELAARRLAARNASAGILITRRTFDADDRCFEFARDLYRADRVEFHVEASIPDSPLAHIAT